MTTVLSALNDGLKAIFADDPRALLMGEDLLDPYGGAFKVSKGLSTAFPDRVITCPISEAGFTGIAAGMAMRGMRPIVEIMFGDFLLLAADQILNHISKYPWMYNGNAEVPIVIRTPMGGRRGYGPTHSQSLEKHFIGMPGLVVVAVNPFCDPGALLRSAVEDDRPVLFIENKGLYARPLRLPDQAGRAGDLYYRTSSTSYPSVSLSYNGFADVDVTLVAYGGMTEIAVEAARELLMEDEISCEVIIPSVLNPLAIDPIIASLERSGRLVTCEEGGITAGFGSEVVARAATEYFHLLKSSPVRVAALDVPIANTKNLEDAVLPQVSDLVAGVRQAVLGESSPSTPLQLKVGAAR